MNDDLQKKLTAQQRYICVERGTEAPFSGKYLHHSEKGTYNCVVCDNPLFSSDTKFEAPSNTGWPSFYDVLKKGGVKLKDDRSFGMIRTEVVCANCDAHLGHLFDDGPKDKTGLHYCVNSAALDFVKKQTAT